MQQFKSGSKNCYVFFEKHYSMNDVDINQTETLDQVFSKYNSNAKVPFNIYVEAPGMYKGVYCGGKVTRCILDIAAKYQNIQAHDIEVRAKSGLALVMLSQVYCPHFSNSSYEIAGKSIDIESLTFSDVFDELDEIGVSLAKDLGNYLSKDLVFKKWASIGKARLALSQFMKKNDVDDKMCLTKLVDCLDSEKKRELRDNLSDAFSFLFDLHLARVLKNFIEKSDSFPDFAFIVGCSHAQWACDVLRDICGAKLVKTIASAAPDKIFSIF